MCKHNKTFHIRFTESEYEKLCFLSEKTGLPKSTYIRFMIKEQVPRERLSPDYYAMTSQLYRIGTLLNQIAARAHIQKLTPTILSEFISKIVFHTPDKSSGKRIQKVEIVYNGVGILNIPELTDEMLRKNRQTA